MKGIGAVLALADSVLYYAAVICASLLRGPHELWRLLPQLASSVVDSWAPFLYKDDEPAQVHPRLFAYFLRTCANALVLVAWNMLQFGGARVSFSVLGLVLGFVGFTMWVFCSRALETGHASWDRVSLPSPAHLSSTAPSVLVSKSRGADSADEREQLTSKAHDDSALWARIYERHELGLARRLVFVRMLNSSVFVPIFEELQRHFMYTTFLLFFRRISSETFHCLVNPLRSSDSTLRECGLTRRSYFDFMSLFLSSLLFGAGHLRFPGEWLCGFLYAVLMQTAVIVEDGRLGIAICAHGFSNFFLGLYVVSKSDWKFW
ncbi:hypothetical protein FVE85_7595 [Porphyridium purpureum]|uniref:CAAX prenyl protease 2/Lysostaphin resistance protein A-like domain-containing protein n=1 Tax=Porphyridium purpureum TaxID=35688 RepID=A0A5J4ZA57_PORPP|nr:hypothetical protein FVE85_7595 [Porphyridium purpureum]|eukprot:POR7146..scf295_1